MLNIEVTQFPGGVGNQKDNSVLNSLPVPGPNVALSVEDFGQTTLFDTLWTVTALGGGSVPSNPLSSSGILRQTSAGAATDGAKAEATAGASQSDTFEFLVGVEAWFGMRVNINDVVNTLLSFGFIPDAATVAPADGVFLRSVDGTRDLEIVSRNTNVEVATVLGQLQDATDYDIAFYWDGIDKVSAQFVGPDGIIGGGGTVLPGALLPAVGLLPHFLYARGAAVGVSILDVDYIFFGGSR